MTLTLLGDVIVSLWLTSVTDSLGRRRILILGAILMAAAGSVFAMASNYWILLGAAAVGVIRGQQIRSTTRKARFHNVRYSTAICLLEYIIVCNINADRP